MMRSLVTRPLTARFRKLGLLLTACLSIMLALPAAGSSRAQASAACDAPSFKDAPRFAAGKDPRALAVADFNGDGKPDLAVANQGSAIGATDGSVQIFLGDAASVFKPGASVNAGLNPRFVVAGDFNRDGKVDLAVLVWSSCCTQGAVTILVGDGGGNFTPTGTLSAVGISPSSMAVGDFNGDGRLDLAVTASSPQSSGVSVLLGDGAGGFGAATFFATSGTDGYVVVGDFNGDGRSDLATANVNGISVSVLLGDGAGGFGPAINTSLQPSNPFSIVAGDFNRDGKLDLVAATTSSDLLVLIGDGTGKFSVGPLVPVLDSTEMIASGDFNGDGKLDVAVPNASNSVSVLLGDGAGGFGAANNYGTGSGPIFVAVADFDGDGKTDLLTANALSDDLSFLKGEGTGDFSAASVYAAGQIPFHAAVADFNRDGIPDIAVANIGQNHVSILLGAGGDKFTAAPKVFTDEPGFVAVADFNGDGKPDLAVANSGPFFTTVSVALGDGTGGFGTPKAFNVGTNPRSIAVGDFNNDGNADLAVANSDSGNFSVLLGDGAGGFTSAGEVTVGGLPNAIITADFNHDCNADLVVLGVSSGASLLLGDGTGKFSAPTAISVPTTRSVAAGDLDGDGNLDLVFANRDQGGSGAAGSALVLLGNGAGGFGSPLSFGVGQRREMVALADFNGDGKADIALLNSSNSVSVLLNSGGATFSAPTDFPLTSGTNFLVAGDLNGDGSPDLLAGGSGSSVTALFNSCPGATRAGRPPAVQFNAPCFAVQEGKSVVQVGVTRAGDLSGEATVDYFTSDGTASDVSDYTAALGRLHFAPNESDKTLRILIIDDSFVEPAEVFHVTLSGPTGAALGAPASATVVIKDNDLAPGPNPITLEASNPSFFVRQHYADFLNREPDDAGLQFWTGNITSCGSDANCIEVKRINVSAAFFLSIEFQETGYLVYRFYKTAYGDSTSPNVAGTVPIVRLREFLGDTQEIGQGVQVGIGNWQQQLEANKEAFAQEFINRQRFLDAYPRTMTAADFVDKLNQNSGGVLSQAERDALVTQLAQSDTLATRGNVLRAVAENSTLKANEFNRAFVLMQYFGYLRRNPDDAPDGDFRGWKFWLDKLNQFNGDFVQAEMVKAFLNSTEYQRRFGP